MMSDFWPAWAIVADLSVTVNITPGLPPWMAGVELAVAEWRPIRGWLTETASYEEANL
jgi:hypothetical protein